MAKDNVNHPSHYEQFTSLECIEVMCAMFGREAVMFFCLCNAFKYMWRFQHKGGNEDLQKSGWYLDWCRNNYKRLNSKWEYFVDVTDRLSELLEECNQKEGLRCD